MVDNTIDGLLGGISRINPETLSGEAKQFLKNFREDIKLRMTIDKGLGNLLARTIIKYHNDTGESVTPLIVELITVSYFVVSSYRSLAFKVTEYLLLGTIFASLTITEAEEEITEIIEQLIMGIFTNPIFEFNQQERMAITGLIFQIEGYISTLDFYSGRFHLYLTTIFKALFNGLIQALEICNATVDEITAAQERKKYSWMIAFGRLKFYLYLFWPMFNLTSNTMLRWLNKKTGIEIWPVEPTQ